MEKCELWLKCNKIQLKKVKKEKKEIHLTIVTLTLITKKTNDTMEMNQISDFRAKKKNEKIKDIRIPGESLSTEFSAFIFGGHSFVELIFKYCDDVCLSSLLFNYH